MKHLCLATPFHKRMCSFKWRRHRFQQQKTTFMLLSKIKNKNKNCCMVFRKIRNQRFFYPDMKRRISREMEEIHFSFYEFDNVQSVMSFQICNFIVLTLKYISRFILKISLLNYMFYMFLTCILIFMSIVCYLLFDP